MTRHLSSNSRTSALALLALLTLCVACAAPSKPTLFSELAPDTLALYAKYVRPTERESAWRNIPWHPTFAGGLRAAGQQQRPLLFWAMNGHPLGCT